MNTLEQAALICRNAEEAIQKLMQEAINAGNYRDLPILARGAEQISQMAAKMSQIPALDTMSVSEIEPSSASKAERVGIVRSRSNVKRSRNSKRSVRSAKSEYPKFRREDDALVKIGWSKASKAEYEHRAPKRVAKALLDSIGTVTRKLSVFTAEILLPLIDPVDGNEVPTYQMYLSLAWLRKEGIVRQHGREGYSLMVKSDLQKLFEDQWNALPK